MGLNGFMKILMLSLCLTISAFAQLQPRHVVEGSSTAVIVLHGINPVHQHLDPLIDRFAAAGASVWYFRYDDGQRLQKSADAFAVALRSIPQHAFIWVVAHSMGGLVARRAATRLPPSYELNLVTVATPFGGYVSANRAQSPFVRWIGRPFGSRDSHADLGNLSPFITNPGTLPSGVRHFKLETVEAPTPQDKAANCGQQRRSAVDKSVWEINALTAGHAAVLRSDVLLQALGDWGFPSSGQRTGRTSRCEGERR